jgi:hypothetical protein
MTMSGTQGEGERAASDPVRRLVLTVLAIYLAPVILIVLVIAGVGMACEAIVRRFHREPARLSDRMKHRHPGAHRLSLPHFRGTAASRSRG